MRCPDCGLENIGGNYCANCGRPITHEAPAPVVPGPLPSGDQKSGSKLGLKLVAMVVVALMVGVIAFSAAPNQTQSVTGEPQKAVQSYYEGVRTMNYTLMADSTILHFDTVNRSAYIDSANYSTPISPDFTISITSIVSVQPATVPSNIRDDVSNQTKALTSDLKVNIQETTFLKVAVIWYGDGFQSNDTRYYLMVLIDHNWYMSYYSMDEYGWDNNHSINDDGYPPVNDGDGGSGAHTPTGSFIFATHDSTEWIFYLGTPGETVLFSDCQLQLELGDVKSVPVVIPSSLHMVIPISSWPSTGYDVTISDLNHDGEITHWEPIVVGPLSHNVGLNAEQPPGTNVTLNLIHAASGITIASYTFTV